MRAEISAAEALIDLLKAYGTEIIFGIPGVHNVEMYRALPRSGIRHILPRHEQAAGFMADGYARASGKPGICFTITGPGLLNILTPMGQAWSDSSPIFVISATLNIKDSAQGRGRLHEMISQRAAAAAVTTHHWQALTPADIEDALSCAFTRMHSERPRPCYLELPLDLLEQPATTIWPARAMPQRPAPPQDSVIAAATMLQQAKNPMLLFGGGAVDASQQAITLAEKLGAITLTTIAGKGIIPASHPLSLGARLPQQQVKEKLAAADVLLVCGSELAETDIWDKSLRIGAKLIRIDIDSASLAKPYPATIAIKADSQKTLSAIIEALPAQDVKAQSQASAQWIKNYLAQEPQSDDALRADLRIILDAIRQSLPQETLIASDMTQIAYAANEIFPMQHARKWLHPVGFGTLGFALPAAIGAKLALGDAPVVALMGDYGLQYTINELGTAAELGQSLPILLWNNDALGQIRDDMVMKAIEPNGVQLVNPDFSALARAYGCLAQKPATLLDLKTAIAQALTAPKPTLIEMTPRLLRD